MKGKDLSRELDVVFTIPSPDDAITLSVSTTTLPADGFSRARLEARVKLPLDISQRKATFRTSTGSLFGAGQSTGSTGPLEIATDSTGVAVAELQSTTLIDNAFVSASAAGITRTATISFQPADPSKIITLTAVPSSAPADGTAHVLLTANVAPALRSREVTFTVTEGTFIEGSKSKAQPADSSNRAVVDLKSPVVSIGSTVRASVGGFSADPVSVAFTQALPETILVSPSSFQLTASATTAVAVTMFRSIGVPSSGLVVSFTAKDSSGTIVGGFSGVSTSTSAAGGASATASATYNPAGTTHRGPLTITAAVGTVIGTATLTIVP